MLKLPISFSLSISTKKKDSMLKILSSPSLKNFNKKDFPIFSFYISYFLVFERWDSKEIYNFFFSKSCLFVDNNTHITLLNDYISKNTIYSKTHLNKADILTILTKFSIKFNFDEDALIHVYNRVFLSSLFAKNNLPLNLENNFLLLKTVFFEYKKLKNFYNVHSLESLNNFYGSSTVLNIFNSNIFLNSFSFLKFFSKNIKFSFLLHFLRVQRRYNKRRYAKSRLYSRPSFFAGVCLSSVIISSFWGGTIKSVDWLNALPIVINVNYVLYILLFLSVFRLIQLLANTVFLNSSNKFKTYYFLNILFFKKLFKKII